MEFEVNIQGNLVAVFRRIGYKYIGTDTNRGDFSFVRPIDPFGYPRFHIYYDPQKGIANIHIDQKRPVYDNQKAHDADYSGPVIEAEVSRIKSLLE